jgi:hypothetical protein
MKLGERMSVHLIDDRTRGQTPWMTLTGASGSSQGIFSTVALPATGVLSRRRRQPPSSSDLCVILLGDPATEAIHVLVLSFRRKGTWVL